INQSLLLILHWFFIGYWILKAGLNFHSDPFFYFSPSPLYKKAKAHFRGLLLNRSSNKRYRKKITG
ncbi:MAG: hypothetical protein ABI480_06025, partial [Chitinophagaceae bacterium]